MTPLSDEPQFFTEVFADEASEIQKRRARIAGDSAPATGLPRNLTGLALSGGGIRSATFCLGVLQTLGRLNLLKTFDYLSTVSGGGFAGGWWSAWLSRPKPGDGNDKAPENVELFPPVERIEPQRSAKYSAQSRTGKLAESSISAGVDPIHHLRLFANYLTPRRGALSMDTWRAIGLIVRNLILTWIVLLPVLLAAVLLGQAYFAWRASDDFPHERMAAVEGMAAGNQPAVAAGFEQTPQSSNSGVIPTPSPTPSNGEQFRQSFVHIPPDPQLRNAALKRRAAVAGKTVALLGALPVLFAFCWLVGIQGGPSLLRVVNSVIGYALFVTLADAFLDVRWADYVLLVGFLALLVAIAIVTLPSNVLRIFRTIVSWITKAPNTKRDAQWEREGYLNSMTKWMSRTLILTVAAAAVLAVAGFGHEAVEYVCCYNAPSGSPLKSVIHYVAKSVSITSVFAAIAGVIYTWDKSAPTGGGDKAEAKKPSATSRLIFAITPPLVIAVLAVSLAWLAHAQVWFVLLGDRPDAPGRFMNARIDALSGATELGIFFGFMLVVLELDLSNVSLKTLHILLFLLFVTNSVVVWRVDLKTSAPYLTLVIASIAVAIVAVKFVWNKLRKTRTEKRPWLAYAVMGVFVYLAGAVIHHFVPHGPQTNKSSLFVVLAVVSGLAILNLSGSRLTRWRFLRDAEGNPRVWRLRLTALLFLIALAPILFGLMYFAQYAFHVQAQPFGAGGTLDNAFRGIIRAGVVFLVIAFIQLWKLRINNRATWLVTSILATLTVLVILVVGENPMRSSTSPFEAVVLLVTTALTWVMTIGWVMDPNMLSMHAFYKGRLVRAYLGASNPVRERKKKEVTDAAEGDDVLLSDMQNCRHGGPYHLINTTLNLAGGRDLVTAQRSSAMFVFSKKYCGSLRTGYRRSSEYMGGELSLGTALAVSGAAVSPNMGSMKTTSSQAMLLTLLNVRLGYWAPTPNKDSWRSPQARLWPYYVVREFLSQTTDLSSYCYLTDGGHFDNTGLYSLVERGCRYLIVVDGSADPGKCFADLGNAVRRCRIDFGAEVDLDITPLIKVSKDESLPRQSYVIGSVKYAREHFEDLGWGDTSEEDRTGLIVYMKPGVLERHPSLSVDVRQYAIENLSFPHQTTADQWFDEAQFESYRALGEQSARLVIESLNISESQVYKRALRKQKNEQKLNQDELNALQAGAVREKIKSGQFALEDVPSFFQSLRAVTYA